MHSPYRQIASLLGFFMCCGRESEESSKMKKIGSLLAIGFLILVSISAYADLEIILARESELPFYLSPSKFINSSGKFGNSINKFSNSSSKFSNSPSKFDNSPSKNGNGKSGKRRLFIKVSEN